MAAATDSDAISIDAVATQPLPGLAMPQLVRFAPDGQQLTLLHAPDGGLDKQLLSVDTDTLVRRAAWTPHLTIGTLPHLVRLCRRRKCWFLARSAPVIVRTR